MGFMGYPEGAISQRGERVDFDRRVRLECRSPQLGSDGGLLVTRSGHRTLPRRLLSIPGRERTRHTVLTASSGNQFMVGWWATRKSTITMPTVWPSIRSALTKPLRYESRGFPWLEV